MCREYVNVCLSFSLPIKLERLNLLAKSCAVSRVNVNLTQMEEMDLADGNWIY